MSRIEILVPELPESVLDATVASWHKQPGDFVKRNEILVDLETDKVILEVPAVDSGIIETIIEKEGSVVISKQLLGFIDKSNSNMFNKENNDSNLKMEKNNILKVNHVYDKKYSLTPFIRRLIDKYNLNIEDIKGTGVDGRLTRYDLESYIEEKKIAYVDKSVVLDKEEINGIDNILKDKVSSNRTKTRISMTRLRKRIAERLLEAKNTTAMLTTFNEVNMSKLIKLRSKYGESFEKKYNVRLGFMSFFVKAVVEALKCYPKLNASIDGSEIVYYNYFDISIAVSTDKGLVTPVLHDVNNLSIAEIEKYIKELAFKSRNDKLKIEELIGGNFTITNGGVFGSFMSTPIINPPQSAILGMHAITERAVVVDGKIEILPMMYLALSYDHRLIDGRDSVYFLVKIKNIIEDPMRLLLHI